MTACSGTDTAGTYYSYTRTLLILSENYSSYDQSGSYGSLNWSESGSGNTLGAYYSGTFTGQLGMSSYSGTTTCNRMGSQWSCQRTLN